jgi:hypothetical protein
MLRIAFAHPFPCIRERRPAIPASNHIHPCNHSHRSCLCFVLNTSPLLPQLELLNLGIAQQYTCYRKPNLSTLSSILENTSLPPIRSLADVFSLEQACRKAKAPQKTGERQIEYRANIKHFDPQSIQWNATLQMQTRLQMLFLSMNAGREVSCNDRSQRLKKPRPRIYGDAQIKIVKTLHAAVEKEPSLCKKKTRTPRVYKCTK